MCSHCGTDDESVPCRSCMICSPPNTRRLAELAVGRIVGDLSTLIEGNWPLDLSAVKATEVVRVLPLLSKYEEEREQMHDSRRREMQEQLIKQSHRAEKAEAALAKSREKNLEMGKRETDALARLADAQRERDEAKAQARGHALTASTRKNALDTERQAARAALSAANRRIEEAEGLLRKVPPFTANRELTYEIRAFLAKPPREGAEGTSERECACSYHVQHVFCGSSLCECAPNYQPCPCGPCKERAKDGPPTPAPGERHAFVGLDECIHVTSLFGSCGKPASDPAHLAPEPGKVKSGWLADMVAEWPAPPAPASTPVKEEE